MGASGAATASVWVVAALPLPVAAGAVPVGSEAMPVVLSIAPEVLPLATPARPDGAATVVSTRGVAFELPVVPRVLVVSIGLGAVAIAVELELEVPPEPVATVLSTAREVVVVVAATLKVVSVSTVPEVLLESVAAVESSAYAFGIRPSEVAMTAIRTPEERQFRV
jgi:hypothetical protein